MHWVQSKDLIWKTASTSSLVQTWRRNCIDRRGCWAGLANAAAWQHRPGQWLHTGCTCYNQSKWQPVWIIIDWCWFFTPGVVTVACQSTAGNSEHWAHHGKQSTQASSLHVQPSDCWRKECRTLWHRTYPISITWKQPRDIPELSHSFTHPTRPPSPRWRHWDKC